MGDKKYNIKQRLDITDEVCPGTFVMTKLKLEEMETGEILEVLLKGKVPLRNVPRSVKCDGHKILDLERLENGIYRLIIEKGQLEI